MGKKVVPEPGANVTKKSKRSHFLGEATLNLFTAERYIEATRTVGDEAGSPAAGSVTDLRRRPETILVGQVENRYAAMKPKSPNFRQGEEMAYRWLNGCCVGCLACSLTAVPAVSQGKGKGHNKHDGDDDGRGKGKKKAKHDFDSQDREVITSYYSGRNSNLPPGLA